MGNHDIYISVIDVKFVKFKSYLFILDILMVIFSNLYVERDRIFHTHLTTMVYGTERWI